MPDDDSSDNDSTASSSDETDTAQEIEPVKKKSRLLDAVPLDVSAMSTNHDSNDKANSASKLKPIIILAMLNIVQQHYPSTTIMSNNNILLTMIRKIILKIQAR